MGMLSNALNASPKISYFFAKKMWNRNLVKKGDNFLRILKNGRNMLDGIIMCQKNTLGFLEPKKANNHSVAWISKSIFGTYVCTYINNDVDKEKKCQS